jgi:hypothetical protein
MIEKTTNIELCMEDYLNLKHLQNYLIQNLNNSNIVELDLSLYTLGGILEEYDKKNMQKMQD